MPTELPFWPRTHFVPDGGEPLLFYVLYGDINRKALLDREFYRSAGVPSGLDLMHYGPPSNADVPGTFRDGYLWEEFKAANPVLASTVANCESCLILRGEPTDSTTLNYLRDTVGLITYLLDQGGVCVYDPLMFRWWDKEEWRKVVFEPAAAVPRQHAVILFSAEEDDPSRKWFHTRGMRKFGRPDISVHHVRPEHEAAVIDLCERLIEHQAFGHVVAEGQSIQMSSLPAGGTLHHQGDLDDPDFNNVHLEAVWR